MPDLVRPLFEGRIMGAAALQRDRIESGQARRFELHRGINALEAIDHFRPGAAR
jgi:hypothetical protein